MADRAASPVSPGSLPPLIDIEVARRWFANLDEGERAGVYTFQLPFQRLAGPTSSLDGREILVFSSCAYLGLADHPRVLAAAHAALDRYGTSTGGVRLMTGTLDLHVAMERELAAFLGQEAALTFASGYAANCAVLGALFGRADVCILDRLAHRSIYEGARLTGGTLRRFAHNDLGELRKLLVSARAAGARRVVIAVDGVFSMDGDHAPLGGLVALKKEFGAFLLLDESHALGAVGPGGRGSWAEQGIAPEDIDIVTGALSKAIPSTGGFVAGSAALVRVLQHVAPPYIFSAALAPANVAAIRAAIGVLVDEPEHYRRLRENALTLREGLRERGFAIGAGASPILPLLLGDEWRAYAWSRWLLEDGIAVSAVASPAVATGAARLRLCATARHEPAHFRQLFAALERCRARESG